MLFDHCMHFACVSTKCESLLEASENVGWLLTGLPTVHACQQLDLAGLGVYCSWTEVPMSLIFLNRCRNALGLVSRVLTDLAAL